MPYIGTSPSNGVRRVHTYTATASQTTFTGASSEGVTLSYADTNYIDVFQNGVLLGSADYTSTSGTSVVLAQGASVDDLIVIVVYDVFSVADTVSKTNGGTFDGNVTVSGAFTSQGIDDNADATAITITSAENVGIGTASPTALSNYTSVVANNSSGSMFELMVGGTRTANMQTSASAMNIQTRTSIPMIFDTNSTEAMKIDANGHITKPLQSAFLAQPSSTQTNFPVNTASTIIFGSERFDQNADFDGTYLFTAPVTGKYQLNVEIFVQAINNGYEFLEVHLVTSNRTYRHSSTPDHFMDTDSSLHMGLSVLADMDAADTAYVQLNVPNTGSAQTDVHTYSSFSGYLVA